MKEQLKKKGLVSAAILATALSAPLSAAVLEEIIVTAQKREQSIQDVGVSVSAFSGEQMKALGVTNTVEITQQVPGLQVNTWSPTLTTFNLRGVSQNNFTDNLEAPVAVYSDEVYIASMNAISGQLFDVERVEVLRGPQGTLFGRNATGGLVHFLSRDASEEDLNGYLEAGFSEYSTKNIEGAIGGSFSDTVRGRFSARWEEGDGYVEGTIPGVRALGGRDGYALRGTLQVDFSDTLTGDFTVKYREDNDVPTGGYVVYSEGNPDPVTGLGLNDGTDVRPFEHDSEYQGYFDRESTSVTGNLAWDLGNGMELVSITNYTELEKFYTEDGDAFPILAVNFTTIADFEQISQEFRLSGEGDTSRWQVGAYYLNIDNINQAVIEGIPGTIGACFGELIELPNFPDSTCLDYAPLGVDAPDDIAIPLGSANTQDVDLSSKNWSIFGQYEYDFSDNLTLILGARWSQDDKDIQFINNYSNDTTVTTPTSTFNAATTLDEAGLEDNDEIDYGDFAARVQLDYRPSDDTLMFVSYNRGIKGGNWSINTSVTPENFRHDEEVLHSYELGTKINFGGTVRINATAFYYDYEDYQAFSLTGLNPQINNSDAEAKGGEVELFYTPNEHWDMIAGLSILDSEVDQVIDAEGGIVRNNELPNAPGYSVNLLARYNWDVFNGNMAIQVDGIVNDDQNLEVTNAQVSEEDGYSVWNASFSYTTGDDHWTVSAWVKNLTDEEYRIYNLDLGMLGATSFYAPPRWFGANVTYRY